MIKDNGTERPSQRMNIKPFANEFSIFSRKNLPCYSLPIAIIEFPTPGLKNFGNSPTPGIRKSCEGPGVGTAGID